MPILIWVILGLIAGLIASKLVGGTGRGLLIDVLAGVVGAVVGGYVFNLAGEAGITGLNIWSIFVSIIGAVIVLFIYHALARRRLLN